MKRLKNENKEVEEVVSQVEPPKSTLEKLLMEFNLTDKCKAENEEDTFALFVNNIKEVINERQELDDLSQKIGGDKRIKKFLEYLISGVPAKEAIDKSEIQEIVSAVNEENNVEDEGFDADYSQEIADFYESKCKDEKLLEEFIAFSGNLITKIYSEPISASVLEVFFLAFKHDEDVKKAFEKGAVNGRNKKIEALRFERENVDGIGTVKAGAVSPHSQSKLGYIERLMKNK
ncbi:MAG: hypothetical protein IMY73_01725 [Bacteroidetes bacterium]|nr:hypothetical protein [Bacteroidota bacterium]